MGKVRAAGAEAVRHETIEAADDGNWVKAEWYDSFSTIDLDSHG